MDERKRMWIPKFDDKIIRFVPELVKGYETIEECQEYCNNFQKFMIEITQLQVFDADIISKIAEKYNVPINSKSKTIK